MVDVIAPQPETPWWVDIALIVCVLVFGIVAMVSGGTKSYIVMTIAIVLSLMFMVMFLVMKGWGVK